MVLRAHNAFQGILETSYHLGPNLVQNKCGVRWQDFRWQDFRWQDFRWQDFRWRTVG